MRGRRLLCACRVAGCSDGNPIAAQRNEHTGAHVGAHAGAGRDANAYPVTDRSPDDAALADGGAAAFGFANDCRDANGRCSITNGDPHGYPASANANGRCGANRGSSAAGVLRLETKHARSCAAPGALQQRSAGYPGGADHV
jgi:hypothetical protein